MLLFVLGRQPALGLAELESLYGPDAVRPLADGTIASVNSDDIIRETGGSIKIARLIDSLPTSEFNAISKQLSKRLPIYVRDLAPDGKVKIGLSSYGLPTSAASLNRTGLYLKNTLKRLGRTARVIPNKELSLSSAQVIHGGLLSDVGLELVLIRDGDQTLVGRTIHEQDIEAYGERDHGRPFRDAFVGMLPPKLAQIMINLAYIAPVSVPLLSLEEDVNSVQPNATGAKLRRVTSEKDSDGTEEDRQLVILDPFCGTGVILQEAALYGYSIYGSDVSEKMIRYTRDNIVWLFDKRHIHTERNYEVADATDHIWRKPIDIVVCEGYLGTPLGGQIPDKDRLARIIDECDNIMRGFLQNIAIQIEPGAPLCVAAPAWFVGQELHHLPVIDDLDKLGYARVEFTHAAQQDLIYRRENQTTGRELLVLTKL